MRKIIALLGVVAFFIFFEFGFVYGNSMSPTLNNYDLLIVSKFSTPRNHDIIVFKGSKGTIVKRVVAGNGEVYNDKYIRLGEYYVVGDNKSNSVDSRYFGTISKEEILGVVCFHCELWLALVLLSITIVIYLIISRSCSYSMK